MDTRADSGRVGVLYTGGTIGTRSIHPELHPDEPTMLEPVEVQKLMAERSGLEVEFEFLSLRDTPSGKFVPVVSSKMGPSDWSRIADTIFDNYDNYDGFVVLHGTDTMAWTACALSFMFGNLSKPVVLTGSQRPISAAPSDAVPNFVNSVMLAGQAFDSIPPIPEVLVCFGDLVLRGNRSTKISTASLQGFDTPNAPHLGRVGRRFEIDTEQLRPGPARNDSCYLRTRLESQVADVVLYPGMPAGLLRELLAANKGAVLRTLGAGNAPGGADIEQVLREAAANGTVMVNITQTNQGTVEAGMLTGSRALADCGVLSGLDLTAEAALTKLMVLLGSESPDVVAEQMQLDQRGEQSIDLVELRASSLPSREGGVSRFVLSRALQAKARPDRLSSAVLRLRRTEEHQQAGQCEVDLYLNLWWADGSTSPDRRSIGRRTLGRRPWPHWDVVVDVTDQCRRLLRTGAAVTLTAVPISPGVPTEIEAVLSLFIDRVVAEG